MIFTNKKEIISEEKFQLRDDELSWSFHKF